MVRNRLVESEMNCFIPLLSKIKIWISFVLCSPNCLCSPYFFTFIPLFSWYKCPYPVPLKPPRRASKFCTGEILIHAREKYWYIQYQANKALNTHNFIKDVVFLTEDWMTLKWCFTRASRSKRLFGSCLILAASVLYCSFCSPGSSLHFCEQLRK